MRRYRKPSTARSCARRSSPRRSARPSSGTTSFFTAPRPVLSSASSSFPTKTRFAATLLAFGTYFIGFTGRPIGAAIFGHYGDRIGRKATLIATLLCMGIATFLVAFVPTYASIGIWGAVILTDLARPAGHWRRRRMGRLGAAGDGMVAHPRPARPGRLLAAIRRARRAVPGELAVLAFSAWAGDQFLVWGWRIPFALSIILVGVGLWIRLGILETPVFQKLLDDEQDREGPDSEVFKKQPREILLSALLRGVRTGAVLHLYRLHLRLRGRHPEDGAEPHSWRRDGGAPACPSSPFRFPATSPTASGASGCI